MDKCDTEETLMDAALRQKIEALITRWGKAVAEKNLPDLLDMLTEDAVFVGSTGPPVVGREAIGAHYSTYFEKFNIREVVTDPPPDILMLDNTIVVWSADRMILTPLDKTPPITLARRTMTLFREENSKWKISRGLSCVAADNPIPK